MSDIRLRTGQIAELVACVDAEGSGNLGGLAQSYVFGASTLIETFYAIQFHEASSVTFTNLSGTNVTNRPFPSGQTIFGNFTSITWVSGSYTAYRL